MKCGNLCLYSPCHPLPVEQGPQRPCLWNRSVDSTLTLYPSVALGRSYSICKGDQCCLEDCVWKVTHVCSLPETRRTPTCCFLCLSASCLSDLVTAEALSSFWAGPRGSGQNFPAAASWVLLSAASSLQLSAWSHLGPTAFSLALPQRGSWVDLWCMCGLGSFAVCWPWAGGYPSQGMYGYTTLLKTGG